jgi:hypothetical protein
MDGPPWMSGRRVLSVHVSLLVVWNSKVLKQERRSLGRSTQASCCHPRGLSGGEISWQAEYRQELLYTVFQVFGQDPLLGSFCVAALNRLGEIAQI